MTTTPTLTATTELAAARRATVPVAGCSLLVALALTLAGANSNSERLSMSVLEIVAAGLVFGLVVPRALRRPRPGGSGIALGAVGLLLVVPAFWSGLPMLFGAAAALIGYGGKRAGTGSGKAMASLVLGLLAVIGYLSVYVLDYLHTHGVM